MCISLSPLNVSNSFITANYVDNSVIVSYSIITSELDTQSQFESQPTNNDSKQTIYAWFLPIKNYSYDQINILDLSKRNKHNINRALDFIENQKERFITRKSINSFDAAKSISDVVTLSDGSQVVRANNPLAIFEEINNVNPDFRQKLKETADVAVQSTNSNPHLKDCACIVYLFKGTNKSSRDYLAYQVPHDGSDTFYLPTVENNHKKLTVDRIIKRDTIFMWGGKAKRIEGDYPLGISSGDNNIVPQYVYGTFDYSTVYPKAKFVNGFTVIDFNNQDPNNLAYDSDCDGIKSFDIF